MQRFGKKKFLQKIKQTLPNLVSVRCIYCSYKVHPFSEWLEFEYGNYYYIFYHTTICGDDLIRYRKQHFDAFVGEPNGPQVVQTLKLINA